jgi:hypothetical protein
MINRLTGEPILPARTANQYLARYWFAVRAGKIGSPVRRPDIGSRFAPVKLVNRSGDLSVKLFAWGEGDSGGHVLRETTSRDLCGLVCPSRTSEGGGVGGFSDELFVLRNFSRDVVWKFPNESTFSLYFSLLSHSLVQIPYQHAPYTRITMIRDTGSPVSKIRYGFSV